MEFQSSLQPHQQDHRLCHLSCHHNQRGPLVRRWRPPRVCIDLPAVQTAHFLLGSSQLLYRILTRKCTYRTSNQLSAQGTGH